MEHLNQNASLQTGQSGNTELVQPLLEFHEIHLVAFGPQEPSHLNDSLKGNPFRERLVHIMNDDIEHLQRFFRTILAVQFTLAQFLQFPFRQEIRELRFLLCDGQQVGINRRYLLVADSFHLLPKRFRISKLTVVCML